MAERKSKKIKGCLLQAKITYPQEEVIICGHCPNMSSLTADLSKTCTLPKN